MAVAQGDGSSYYTQACYTITESEGDGAPSWWNEEVFEAPGDWDGPAGNGEEWGQKITKDLWNVWSYNDSSEGVEDWEDGTYTITYVQNNL